MLRKTLVILLTGLLITASATIESVSAQTQKISENVEETSLKLSKESLLKTINRVVKNESQAEYDFEKETIKSSLKKQNKLSSGAKTAIAIGIVAVAVVIVAVLVTRGNDDVNPPQCSQFPCP